MKPNIDRKLTKQIWKKRGENERIQKIIKGVKKKASY